MAKSREQLEMLREWKAEEKSQLDAIPVENATSEFQYFIGEVLKELDPPRPEVLCGLADALTAAAGGKWDSARVSLRAAIRAHWIRTREVAGLSEVACRVR